MLWFEVGVGWAEKIISRVSGKRPLQILCDLQIIEPKIPHRSTIRTKSITYQFLMSKFGKYLIELTGKAADKAKQSGKRGQERKEADPVYSWVQFSLNLATLKKDDLDEYKSRKNHKKYAEKFGNGERHQSWKGLYHRNTVCQMPKDLRNRLLFNGEIPVARLDISSSYASMLPWLLEDDTWTS